MNKLGTKLGAIAMSAVMALTFAPSAAITSLAAGGDDLTDATQELSVPVYRLYNPNSGEHLFTTKESERDYLDKNDWDYEDIAWYAPTEGDQVYRLYNPNHPLGDHHYTASQAEVDNLLNAGWKLDENAFYTAEADDLLRDEVISLYNPNAYALGQATHHLTLSQDEADNLEKLGWKNEGVKFYGYAADLDPEVEELTVSINNTTPKVGDTLTATVEPDDAVVTYQWLADGEDILGANKATLFVDDDYVGSKLSVEVTDEDGNTAVSDETARVTADKSEDVKIIDKMGLQSDGTAIIGDRLALSYGVTFGTPSAITWYKDGSVLKTWSSGNSGQQGLNQDGGLYKDVSAGDGAGTYSATVVAEGVTYTTNEIVVTTAEEAAEIIGFKIEDDYTDGTDIVYDTKDYKAVATVTLKKNYDGKIAIYKANDNKFKGVIDSAKTSTAVAEKATKYYVDTTEGGENHEIAGNSVLTTDQATNFQILNLKDPESVGAAVGHINADGSATYKFQVNDGVFTRGQNYVVVFDQASVVTDTPGTGITNVFDEEATVPYVETPAAIAVTKVSAGNYPEVSFVDKDGNTLAWFGETTKKLSTSGIDKGEIYYAKSKLNDPEKGTKQGVDITTAKNIEKGVWKSDVKAAVNDDKYIDAYWFASVTTKKGIFDKDAVTLTSEAVPTAQKSADTINLVEDSTTSTSATVKFTNLRADGTVYIVRGLKERTKDGKDDDKWDGTDYSSAPEHIFKAYEAGINEAIVGKEEVEAGAASVTVAQAIGEYETKNKIDHPDVALGDDTAGYFPINNYIAVFVPDDEVNYGMIYTADGLKNEATKEDSTKSDDSQGLSLTQVATSIKYDKATAGEITTDSTDTLSITGTTLLAYDQFGKVMTANVDPTDVTSVTATSTDVKNPERGSAKYSVAGANGQVTVKLTMGTDTDIGDFYTITVLGSTITVKNLYGDTPFAKNTATAGARKVLEVKVGSDTLFAPPARVLTTAPIATTQNVLAVVFDTGAKDQDNFAYDMSGLNGKAVTTNGITATISNGKKDGTFTITFAGKTKETIADNGKTAFAFTVGTKTLTFTITDNGGTTAGTALTDGAFDACVAEIS